MSEEALFRVHSAGKELPWPVGEQEQCVLPTGVAPRPQQREEWEDPQRGGR